MNKQVSFWEEIIETASLGWIKWDHQVKQEIKDSLQLQGNK